VMAPGTNSATRPRVHAVVSFTCSDDCGGGEGEDCGGDGHGDCGGGGMVKGGGSRGGGGGWQSVPGGAAQVIKVWRWCKAERVRP
jgi:hypothetical protein